MLHPDQPWCEVECRNADEFLEKISPLNTDLWRELPDHYYFRGHVDSEWGLVPSAFRLPRDHYFYRTTSVGNDSEDFNAFKQLACEVEVFKNFVIAADRQGIQLPEDSLAFLTKWTLRATPFQPEAGVQELQRDLTGWPPQEVLSTLSVAQHYGIPTRLLDWTRDPYAAAYFAAREAAPWARWPHRHPKKAPAKICIWALHGYNLIWDGISTAQPPGQEILAVNTPNALNPNKTAQKGIFTFSRPKREYPAEPKSALIHDVRCMTHQIHEALWRSYGEESIRRKGYAPLTRITLSFENSIYLLKRLHHLGYDAGSIFPGLQGAAWRVEERATYSYPMSNETGHNVSRWAVYLDHEPGKISEIQEALGRIQHVAKVRIEEPPKPPITLIAVLTFEKGASVYGEEEHIKATIDAIDGVHRCEIDTAYYERTDNSTDKCP